MSSFEKYFREKSGILQQFRLGIRPFAVPQDQNSSGPPLQFRGRRGVRTTPSVLGGGASTLAMVRKFQRAGRFGSVNGRAF